MSLPAPRVLINLHCKLGENPYWDARRRCVYWTDIDDGKLLEYNPATRASSVIYSGEPVGGFTQQANGDLLLFRVRDIATLRIGSSEARSLIPVSDDTMARFNDVIADPEGRVFAGTIGKDKTSGGLYLLERDGSIQKLFAGTRTANGMGFSPDLKSMYWTCTTSNRIFRFDYDRATGALSNRQTILEISETDGKCDGMTVDSDGNLWSARWNGFGVFRYTPAGKLLDSIQFPVAKVSSLIFGGDAMNELFITTAGGVPDSDSLDGALFHLRVPAQGQPEFPSRILL